MTPVVLASSSPTRAAMLRAAGVPFRVESPAADEEGLKQQFEASGLDPRSLAAALADAKALSVRPPGALVVAADQTLSIGDRCLHKARDLDEARRTLILMRNRTHQLHSAAALARDGDFLWRHVCTARLTMRDFSDSYMDAYLARHGKDLLSSVGCYKIEEDGVQLFSFIDGDYFAILGLPMTPLLEALRDHGGLPR